MSTVNGCPECGAETTRIVEARPYQIGWLDTRRRRRLCESCKHRFWTVEVPQEIAEDVFNED